MNLSLLKSTVLAAALCWVGGEAYAATETYDFKSFVGTSAPTLTLTGSSIEQSGTNAKTVTKIGKQTNKSDITVDFSRIALCSDDSKYKSQKKVWMWRYTDNTLYQIGLAGRWTGNGTDVTSYNISVIDLHKDDKVIITYAYRSGKSAELHVCSSDVLSDGTNALAAEDIVESGKTYTVLNNGNLDMYDTDNNMAIQSIVIESDYIAESIDAPTISVVGTNGGSRIVAITPNNTNAGNATKTYYTTDGSEPTTSSTEYTGNITVSESQATNGNVTIKAITVKDGAMDIKSSVTTYELTGVGTNLPLNAPVVSVNFKEQGSEGLYMPIYTFSSDQSTVLGNPTVTYSYKINDKSADNVTDYDVKETGTLTITASAEGYTPTTTTVNITNLLFKKTYSYDFTTLTTHSETGVGGQQNFHTTGCQAYSLETNAFDGITLNGMSQLWAITKGITLGLYARSGDGSIKYDGAFPEGAYMIMGGYDGTSTALTTATVSYSQYGFTNSIAVYVPVKTISLNDSYVHSTYCPESDLDFTDVTDVEVYKVKVEGNKAVSTKVEGKIQAGEGILLKRTGDATSVTVPTTTGAEKLTDNDLVGAEEDITSGWDSMNAYMLVSDTQFQKIGTGTLAKGKAYLLVSDNVATKNLSIYFGDEVNSDDPVTAINGVADNADAQNGAIYTLQGVKVEKAEKGGIYIINGKKYIK